MPWTRNQEIAELLYAVDTLPGLFFSPKIDHPPPPTQNATYIY